MNLIKSAKTQAIIAVLIALTAIGNCQVFIGMTRPQLISALGEVKETNKSVDGPAFVDFVFYGRSKVDNHILLITATMIDGRCHGIAFQKMDDQMKDTQILNEEMRALMLPYSKAANTQWKFEGEVGQDGAKFKQWKLDKSATSPNPITANAFSSTFVIETDELLRRRTSGQ